ncbi:MAG: hypothetical protein RBG13Loki_2838 [Promethearchaeota archaeon CR_4]|nr:MAG: hypothetical protein RBG13Loki_2838 [Candidatus Lokiarchaeota archaeon CR_4]
MSSEIPRFLSKTSQTLRDKSIDVIEGILKHVLYFTRSLTELPIDQRIRIQQIIIKQSQDKLRSLSDVLLKFIEKAEKGDFFENEVTFQNILVHAVQDKIQLPQIKENELYIKQAETQFCKKIGQEKASSYSDKISASLKAIDKEIQNFMISEIAKYLFNFSQTIENLTPESLESILTHILRFINVISDLGGMNQAVINQNILKRSGKKSRGIFDLFLAYIAKIKENPGMETELGSLEDIMNYVYGLEEKITQFTDVGGFIKRAEKLYAEKIGEAKAKTYCDQILTIIPAIPETHRSYFGSDIAKLLLTYSENIERITPEEIELTLACATTFLISLKELDYLNQEQLNKVILFYSDHKARTLLDFFNAFVNKSRATTFKVKDPTFDDILLHTFGLHVGPKLIGEAPPLHELMIHTYHEFPLAQEHKRWAFALFNAIQRYLEILQNEQGDTVLNQLWNNTFPKDQIIDTFQEKVDQLPREDAKSFFSKLLNLLSQPILTDKSLDRALTGAVAFVVLARVFIEMFCGKNATIRALKIRDHLEERTTARIERKNDIDYDIQKIIEEDYKALQKNTFILKTIITIVSNKDFFIKISDLVEEDYPKDLVEVYTAQDALRPIKKHYLDSSLHGEIIIALKFFLKNLDSIKKFHDTFIYDFLSIPQDAMKKLEILKEFFVILLDLRENLEANKFYSQNVEIADHQIYFAVIKYLYEPLSDIFQIILSILQQKEASLKIESLPQYLSNEKNEEHLRQIQEIEHQIRDYLAKGFTTDSDKIKWLHTSLDHENMDVVNFQLITRLVTNVTEITTLFSMRLAFSKTLMTCLLALKTVHRNLSAAFSHFLDNIATFDTEIDGFLEEIRKTKELGYILPNEFEIRKQNASMVKKQLFELRSDQKFLEQLKVLQEINQKNIMFN